MYNSNFKVLLTHEQIQKRVKELAEQIPQTFKLSWGNIF